MAEYYTELTGRLAYFPVSISWPGSAMAARWRVFPGPIS
jgi:hypothetical protein